MKKLIIALAVALVPLAAYAGMNKQQQSNSNARWVHNPSGNTYQIGRQLISVRIPDISTASSEYVYIPEAGVVTAVHCVLSGAITGANATIAVADGKAAGGFTTLTVTQSGSAIGDIDSSTGLSESVDAGAVMVVGTNGQSAGTHESNCVIILDPAAQ